MTADWRTGLASSISYRRKFAIRPVYCSDGTKVWFKYYYSKYISYGHDIEINPFDNNEYYIHKDFAENITEAEYIVRKLADNL